VQRIVENRRENPYGRACRNTGIDRSGSLLGSSIILNAITGVTSPVELPFLRQGERLVASENSARGR
jgi:hypothetical protein